MKKIFLGGFILLDLAFIGGSVLVLYSHVQRFKAPSSSLFTPQPASQAAPSPQPVTSAVTPIVPHPAVTNSASRKILFSYRNPHVKQVSIRADFTGWKAEPMQKAPNGNWTYQALLTPGEYAYCFTADDKTFKDPANKRTKQIGRTLVSAILVEPPSSKNPN